MNARNEWSEPMADVTGVHKAINAVQAALTKEGIGKDRKNQAQGYSFRGIDDMYNVMSPLLAANGLVVLPKYSERQVTEHTSAKGATLFYVTLRGDFTFLAGDGTRVEVSTYGEAMDSGDKATNKAMSAALKYAFMQTFTIPTEGDNDSENQTHEVRNPPRGSVADVKKDAFDAMSAKQQEEVRKIAAEAVALIEEDRAFDAYGYLKNQRLDADEQVGLQHLLSAPQRTALKKAAEQWKLQDAAGKH